MKLNKAIILVSSISIHFADGLWDSDPCMYYGPVVWYLAYSIYFYVLRRIWLMIAKKIPGAWLSQIRDAGHGLMYRYPDNFSSDIHIFAVC